MSAQTIRTALSRLQDDPDHDGAWSELQDAATSPNPGLTPAELTTLLEAARREHAARGEWDAVTRLLELELVVASGDEREVALQTELARVLENELFEDLRSAEANQRLLVLDPHNDTAHEALARFEARQAKWQALVERYASEAADAEDAGLRSALLFRAAEAAWRFGRRDAIAVADAAARLEDAVGLDPKNDAAALLLERLYVVEGRWQDAARCQERLAEHGGAEPLRVAAYVRLARVLARRLGAPERAAAAYERALSARPGNREAMSFLSEYFVAREQWDNLIALYEEQLRSGATPTSDEAGIVLQIAMVEWRTRGRPEAAAPWFERLRRLQPAHPGMLAFFREWCVPRKEMPRLIAILSDAQRSMADGAERAAIGDEIARFTKAETADTSPQRAIEQYKALLRHDPANTAAREALRGLYTETQSWSALAELLRQGLERTPLDDTQTRLALLREMAAVYRDHVKSDTALATVLTQVVQLDPHDAEAIRSLVRVYEGLSRWRDLLVYQQRLAELTGDRDQKVALYRATARRWLEQFSNAQNAIESYEAILRSEPRDDEARARLHELYTKRRAWAPLYALLERDLSWAEGASKTELLIEMAKLASERLDRGADAIALYKRALEEAPNAPGLLDAIEKQAERERDYRTVADVLEKRATLAPDHTTRVAVLQKLGDVYLQRLDDVEAAVGAWQRVLELQPANAKALRVLRETFLGAGDVTRLEALYAAQNDWEGLAEVLSAAADRTTSDDDAKVALSIRAAHIYEGKLNQPERAFRAYERILSVRPDDASAAAALIPIYEHEERWARLPALYEVLLASSSDASTRVRLLRTLSEMAGQKLQDRQGALSYARRAYDADPDAPGALDVLEQTSRAAGTWDTFVEAVGLRLDAAARGPREPGAHPLDPTERRALATRLADVCATERGDTETAVALYRALIDEDPSDEHTTATLDRLLRATGRRDELRWLYDKRVDAAERNARVALLDEWAALEDDAFGEPVRAIHLYRRALELDATDARALAALPSLLLNANDPAGAVDVIKHRRDGADGDERAECEIELASIYLDRLADPGAALDASTRALRAVPQEPRATALLERLLEEATTRGGAAAVLRRVYTEAGDPRREARVLAVMLEEAKAPAERMALATELANLHEHVLGASGAAFDVVLRALRQLPREVALWEHAEALAASSGRPVELADALREAMRNELPEELEIYLGERAARLHDEVLGDAASAIPYLERVLARQPTNERAFARLRQILTSTERWAQLEELYERVAEATADPARRMALYAEIARVCDEVTGERAKAIRYYERVREIEPGNDRALRALDALYQAENQPRAVASLLEARLPTAAGREAIEIRRRLGRIYVDDLQSPALALGHLEEVLRSDPSDVAAAELVERVLSVGELRLRAADMLAGAYEARGQARDLVRVLEVRLEGSEGDDVRRELLGRIAQLRDQRLQDDPGSLNALVQLVPLDPTDAAARARLREIGARLGEQGRVAETLLAAAERTETREERVAILMEVARVYEESAEHPERAQAVYQRIIGIDRNDAALVLPAARALERIYATQGDHAALAETLALEVALEADASARAELWASLGELYETTLDDPSLAIRAWRGRLDDIPADHAALGALERLYERVGEWRELVGVLRAREQATNDARERRRLLIKAAETLTEKIHDTGEAIAVWRLVVDDFGAERAALRALERLYEASGAWPELVETLENELALSDETAERLVLLAKLGDARRQRLGDFVGATESYRQALALDPADAASRAALEHLLDHVDARREAAAILRPLYEVDGDAERLVRVLDVELAAAETPHERLAAYAAAARVAEGPLNDPGRAFGYATHALRDAVNDESLRAWLDRAQALAATTGRYEALVEALAGIAPHVGDDDARLHVTLRVADLANEHLGDSRLAREWYRRALELREDEPHALEALDRLYEASGEPRPLLATLKRRIEIADSDEERRALLYREARLEREELSEPAAAIATYEAILDLGFDMPAADALETLYTEAHRGSDLIHLYERQLDAHPSDAPALRIKLARASEHYGDMTRAFDELAAALTIEPQHDGATHELERLLHQASSAELRARAADMLEPVYVFRADWNRLVASMRVRLDACTDSEERRALLKRLVHIHEEQSEDYGAALRATAELVHDDPTDAEAWADAERLARVAGAEPALADLYANELAQLSTDDAHVASLARRAGELFAQLGQHERALTFYRRAYAFEPESRADFRAIDDLLVRTQKPAERVALYRAAFDYLLLPAERVSALQTIAEIEEQSLRNADAAMDAYRAALDIDGTDASTLEALTRLYTQHARHRDLAELYVLRIDFETDTDRIVAHRLALARLYRYELDDASAAIDQLDAVATLAPDAPAMLDELEALTTNPAYTTRALDILQPLYERADNWKSLSSINERRFELTQDVSERVSLLRQNAQIFETRAADSERAFEALRRAFALDPEDRELRAELERLASQLRAWSALAEAYEQGVTTAEAGTVRELLSALAALHDEKRNDARSALQALERLAALDENEIAPLEAAEPLALLLGDWPVLAQLLTKQSELVNDDAARARILQQLGGVHGDMLDDAPSAIRAYERALELAPDTTTTIDALLPLYEASGGAERLVDLYRRRAELAGGTDTALAFDLLLRTAHVQHATLGNRREAIDALREALVLRPSDPRALRALSDLLRAESLWTELLENLRREADVAPSPEERAAARREMGELYASELREPAAALETYRLVFGDAPADAATIAAVLALAEANEDVRLAATELLEPVLRGAGRSRDLISVLEMRLGITEDAYARAATSRAIATAYERDLAMPTEALSAVLRALADTPIDESLHADAERLAAEANAYESYADALNDIARSATDALVAKQLYTRLGRIAETKLSDLPRAVAAYIAATSQLGDTPELLAALDALYTRTGAHGALVDVLERCVALDDEPASRADYLLRLARLYLEAFDDAPKALATLRTALDLRPDHEGARAAVESLTDRPEMFDEAANTLDAIYRSSGDNAALARLLEKRISRAAVAPERVRLRLELARVLETSLADTRAAQSVLEEAVSDDPSASEVVEGLARLATTNHGFATAASALDRSLATAHLPAATACELYLQLAGWHTEHLADSGAAERALLRALERDGEADVVLRALEQLRRVPGRERDLVETLRVRARIASDDAAKRDLLREAHTIASGSALDDATLSESVLRQALDEHDADLWVIEELTKLRQAASDWPETMALLLRASDLARDAAEARERKKRAAQIAREKLGDNARALALYEELFEADSDDHTTATALRDLYGELGREHDLARVLSTLIDRAVSPSSRTALRLDLATLQEGRLGSARDAASTLRAALDEEPAQADVVFALTSLYERTGQDEELAELLSAQAAVADQRGELLAYVAFESRLAEILEQRLGDTQGAIAAYERIVTRDGSHLASWLALARLQEGRGDASATAAALEKALDLEPGAALVTNALRLADAYAKTGDDDAARRALERALATEATHGEVRERLRTLYEKNGAWAPLAQLLASDADLADNDAARARLLRQAADIHLAKRSDAAAATTLLERASALAPSDRDLLFALCDAYGASGRSRDAVEALEKIARSFTGKRLPEVAAVHHRLASAYLADGDKARALVELDAAFKNAPGSIPVLKDLGALAMDTGDLDRAQKMYRALLLQRLDASASITKAEVFYNLGVILNLQGDRRKAMDMLQRALENDPKLDKARTLLAELRGSLPPPPPAAPPASPAV